MNIGTQIGPYRIESLLGRGGMAEVYKVWHLGLHRWEALKVLPPERTFDRSFVEQFLAEARMAARLQHPNIAAIYDVSDSGGSEYYFAMEMVEGPSLAAFLEAEGCLPLSRALPILTGAAEAIDYAHSYGIIHRDIKPANILLNEDGQGGFTVKVVDFGIGRANQEEGATRLTQTGMMIGTPEYMSPEAAGSGAVVDHRTDIYSLGVVAYETICGQPPFIAVDKGASMAVLMAHVMDAPPPPMERDPSLGDAINNALLKALAKNPNDRYNTCRDFIEALARAIPERPAALSQSIAAANPNRLLDTKESSSRSSILRWASWIVVLLLTAGVVMMGFERYKSSKRGSEVTAAISPAPKSAHPLNTAAPQASLPSNIAAPQLVVQSNQQEITTALTERIDNWKASWERGDLKVFMSNYTPDARIFFNGRWYNNAQFRANEDIYFKSGGSRRITIMPLTFQIADAEATIQYRMIFSRWGGSGNYMSWGQRAFRLHRDSDGTWLIQEDVFHKVPASQNNTQTSR